MIVKPVIHNIYFVDLLRINRCPIGYISIIKKCEQDKKGYRRTTVMQYSRNGISVLKKKRSSDSSGAHRLILRLLTQFV